MIRVIRIAAGVGLLALALPEVGRYAAERKLRQMEDAVRAAQSDPRYGRVRLQILDRVAADASRLDRPGDWRPLQIAAAARLAAGQPEAAAAAYSRANAIGERPELARDLGVALHAAGRAEDAEAAMLRAVWISPPLLDRTGGYRSAVERRVADLDARLRAGAFVPSDLPPLPVVREERPGSPDR